MTETKPNKLAGLGNMKLLEKTVDEQYNFAMK